MSRTILTSLDNSFQQRLDGTSNNRAGMKFELFRLTSYKNWPRWAPIQPNRLAKAGFFYTGQNDETECFSCHCKMGKWHEGDMPEDRHRRIKPDCPLMSGAETANVPLPRPADSPDQPVNSILPNSAVGSMQSRMPRSVPTASSSTVLSSDSVQSEPFGSEVPRSALLPDYQREARRLETFRNWPMTAYVGPEELAQAGFIYLGSSDRVQCAFCKGVLKNWAPGDSAFSEHQKHFPHCSFVRNPAAARSPYHEFASESVRLSTFNNWPNDIRQKPADLAEAGFYYNGQADNVKCYWCDGDLDGLRNWDANNDPWVEHARWFPNCGHVMRAKGLRFIERVKAKQQNTSTAVAPQAQDHVVRQINPHEITSRMDTPIVKRVLDMGYNKKFVQNIIEYQLRTSRVDFAHWKDLLEMCLQFSNNPPSNFPLEPLGPVAANRTLPEPPVPQKQEMEAASPSKDKKKNKRLIFWKPGM